MFGAGVVVPSRNNHVTSWGPVPILASHLDGRRVGGREGENATRRQESSSSRRAKSTTETPKYRNTATPKEYCSRPSIDHSRSLPSSSNQLAMSAVPSKTASSGEIATTPTLPTTPVPNNAGSSSSSSGIPHPPAAPASSAPTQPSTLPKKYLESLHDKLEDMLTTV